MFDLNLLCDINRGINIFLAIGVLVLLQRSLHIKSANWTSKTRDLHKFLTGLMLIVFLGGTEKILDNSEPAMVVPALTFVLLFGYRGILKKEAFTRE
jgi:hypothetical protein